MLRGAFSRWRISRSVPDRSDGVIVSSMIASYASVPNGFRKQILGMALLVRVAAVVVARRGCDRGGAAGEPSRVEWSKNWVALSPCDLAREQLGCVRREQNPASRPAVQRVDALAARVRADQRTLVGRRVV